MFTRDNSDVDSVLDEGGEVGVVLGFQGFIFSRVGVYSPYPLGERTHIKSRAIVEGDITIDVTTTHSAIKSWPRDDGTWETEAMWMFFNNNPLTDLIGHPATFSFLVPTEVCELTVTLDVNLISAGEMGEEGFEDCEPQCVPD